MNTGWEKRYSRLCYVNIRAAYESTKIFVESPAAYVGVFHKIVMVSANVEVVSQPISSNNRMDID